MFTNVIILTAVRKRDITATVVLFPGLHTLATNNCLFSLCLYVLLPEQGTGAGHDKIGHDFPGRAAGCLVLAFVLLSR